MMMRTSGDLDPHVARLSRSLARWRLILLALVVVVPAGLYALFERQARRLDALGDHGAVTEATVVEVSRQGASTFVSYEYSVDGATYSWTVAQRDAPYPLGETFAITYLPEDPTLSRPGADRSRGTVDAASNRSFARKAVAGVFAFFALLLVMSDWRLRRLRRLGRAGLNDPRANRTTLVVGGVILVPVLMLVFGWHAADASQRGEPIWPVVLGIVGSLAVLGAAVVHVLREGPAQAAARAARLRRWLAPIAVAIAVLRALAWLAGWQ